MTDSSKETLERIARRIAVPDPAYERMLLRRDRKRRNQRITAGVVGIAVFVASLGIVTTFGSSDRTRPAVPGGAVTGPAETGPTVAPDFGWDAISLPPEGAVPSEPESGELVLSVWGRGIAAGRAFSHIHLYADGRLIWSRDALLPEGVDGPNTGLVEQRLTPEGVELMRADVISSGLFGPAASMVAAADRDPLPFLGTITVRDADRLVIRDFELCHGCSQYATVEQERALARLDARLADPASWLPASAWADREMRIYVPSTYQFCYAGGYETIEQDRLLDALPGPAREALRGAGRTEERVGATYQIRVHYYCKDLTTEQTHVVVRALEDAGIVREPVSVGPFGATFVYNSIAGSGEMVRILIDPNLPHGEALCIPCLSGDAFQPP